MAAPVEVHVASDPHVLHSHQPCNAVDMVEDVLHCGRPGGLYESSHHGHSHDASGCGHLPNRFICLAASPVGNQRPAVRVCHENRFARGVECVKRRSVAAVGNVDCHTQLVHSLDHRCPKIGQPRIILVACPSTYGLGV